MKICFIAPKAYPIFNPKIKSTFGGAEVQLYLLATELAKNKDLDINFMVADYGQKEIEKQGEIKLFKSMSFKDNKIKQVKKFFKIFNIIDADVYVQRGWTSVTGLIALYCKIKRKKFIYMIANDGETDDSDLIYRSKTKKLFSKFIFRHSNLVIVQNKFQLGNIKKKNMKVSILNSSSHLLGNKIKDKKYILWVGRADRVFKNPEIFLDIVKAFSTENFIMIAPPATGQKEYFDKLKLKANTIKNLKFFDFVPFDKIDSYFEGAKIFINTSVSEGFPSTFVQAVSSKVPIVSLNVNPNNFLDKYSCGFCCKGDFNKMISSIRTLLKNKKLYSRFSDNAYKYAKENHDIKKNARKFLEMIK